MPDRYDPKLALRPVGERKPSDSRRAAAADDPLAELAALVSGRGSRSKQAPAAPPPASDGGDVLGDLETELLNDLQASFAAVRDMVAVPPPSAAPKEPPRAVDIEPPRAPPPLPPELPELPDPDLPLAGLAERFAPEPPPVFREPEPPAEEPPAPVEPARRPLPVFLQLSDLQLDPPDSEPAAPETAFPARASEESAPSAFGGFQVRVSDTRTGQPADVPLRPARSRWQRPEPPRQPEANTGSRFAPPKSAGLVPPGQRAFDDDDLDQFADMAVAGDDEVSAADFPLEGFNEAPEDDGAHDPPYQEDLASMIEPRRSRTPLLVGSVIAIVLLGGIAVAMFRPEGIVTEEPPVIVADGLPTKITPDEPEVADAEQNKLIYDRVNPAEDGAETTQLASRDEPITEVGSDTLDNPIARVIIPGGPGFDEPATDEGLSLAGQPSTLAEAGGLSDDLEEPLDALGPRRVRTVVVKPDGTIVESGAAEFGAAPAAEAGSAAAATETVAEPQPPPLPERSPAAANDDTLAIAGGNSELAITPVPEIGGNPAAEVIAAPAPPAAEPAPPPQNTTVAAADPSPPPSQPVPSGGMLVQVSSQRSEDAARATFRDLQARYPGILGAYEVNIQRAEIPDRGTFYRVRVGPFSASDAQRLCNDLKAAGGDCILAQG